MIVVIRFTELMKHDTNNTGCPLSFETGGTIAVFFLNFVPLHVESPYNFEGTGPILRVNGHAAIVTTHC